MHPTKRIFLRFLPVFLLLSVLLIPSRESQAGFSHIPDSRQVPPKVVLLIPEGQRGTALSKTAMSCFNALASEGGVEVDPLFIKTGTSGDVRSFEEIPNLLNTGGAAAAVSLLRGPDVSHLYDVSDEIGIPLLMVWSEMVPAERKSRQMLFSIDFPETFRASAIALWACGSSRNNWSMFIDHLDARSREMGNLSSQALSGKNLDFMTTEVLRNNPDGFVNFTEKCLSCGSKNILSWLSPSDTLKLQQTLRSLGASGIKLIYGGDKNDMLLKSNGITVFSQEPFADRDIRSHTDRHILSELGDQVELSEFIKIKTALSWVSQALATYMDGNRPADDNLSSCLRNTERISVNGFLTELSPQMHRPLRKAVYILESENGKWAKRDRIYVEYSGTGCSIADL